MSDSFAFELDVDPDIDDAAVADENDTAQEPEALSGWAENQLAGSTGPLFFDIETGPLSDEQLQAVYHEKTLEEFSATCDKRWKPDTVAVKYEEYKASDWSKFVGKAALSATTGRVLLIGVLHADKFLCIGRDDEKTNLEEFWGLIDTAIASKQRMIGHNSNSFDLPFLVRRSWLLGVPMPREIRHGRYWNPLFLDTMEAWSFGAREYTSLNDIGRFFGVGQKSTEGGVSGAQFAKFWHGTPEQRQLAVDYNEQDLRMTAAIAAKMDMV